MLEDDATLTTTTTTNNFLESCNDIKVGDEIHMTVSAPGKVILFGEHSVVYGKLAVAASLGLRTKLSLIEHEVKAEQPNYIKVELPDINLVHVYELKDLQHSLLAPVLPLTKSPSSYNWKKPNLINYDEMLHIIIDYITRSAGSFPLTRQQNFSLCSFFYILTGIFASVNIDLKPFTIHIKTELSISSGSGSSASYSVTIAAALIHYLRVVISKRDVLTISKDGYKATKPMHLDFKSFNEKELEIISRWAYVSEKIMHGSPSGIDNAVCTYGSLVEFQKSTGAKLIQFNDKLKLLLINTAVKRDTKQLVSNVAALKVQYPRIVEPVLEAMDQVAHKAVECFSSFEKNPFDAQKKEMYFKEIGVLTDINHHLLQVLGVSHPTLDKICTIVKNFKLNAKLTGAGGGGYAIALISPDTSKETIDRLRKALLAEGFESNLADLAGRGVTIDSCNVITDCL